MKLKIEIPDYDNESTDVIWEAGAKMNIIQGNEICILANKEGLISIAKQMLYFAYNDLPQDSHVHLDSFFCKLSDNSKELIISRKDDL